MFGQEDRKVWPQVNYKRIIVVKALSHVSPESLNVHKTPACVINERLKLRVTLSWYLNDVLK